MKNILAVSFFVLLFSAFIVSCSDTVPAHSQEFRDTIIKNAGIGSCQYLTVDNEGSPVLCRVVEDTSDSRNNIIQISRWDKEKNGFRDPMTIPGSKSVQAHDEGMPKIAFRKDGSMVVVYSIAAPSEKNKYAAIVYYVLSGKNGDSWSEPVRLVQDTVSYSQRFFDVVRNNDGEVSAVWLDSRKAAGEKGSTLYYAETLPGGGFQGEKVIARTTCECCRTKIYSDSKGGINIAFRDILNDSIRDMSYIYSEDRKHFTSPITISNDNWVLNGCPHTGPDLSSLDGKLHFTWYTQGGEEGVYYCNSSDKRSFTDRMMISNSGKHPQMASVNEKILITYEEIIKTDSGIVRPIKLATIEGSKIKSVGSITEQNIKASYPVIIRFSDHILIAWNQKINGRPEILYQVRKG